MKIAKPLASAEIEDCLAALRAKHPVKTDFTPPRTTTKINFLGGVTTTEYSAPAASEIANYRDVQYPQWIERCRGVLGRLHERRDEIEPATVLKWVMSNKGSRPASQVRVEFVAKGPLSLQRLKEDDDDDQDTTAPQSAMNPPSRFPAAPRPPAFAETVSHSGPTFEAKTGLGFSMSALSGLGGKYAELVKTPKLTEFARIARDLNSMSAAARVLNPPSSIFGKSHLDPLVRLKATTKVVPHIFDYKDLVPPISKPRDREKFYYEWPVKRPVCKGMLTCDLWRHKTDDEILEFEVIIDKEGAAGGVVICTVHADNLTNPAQAKVVVQRTVEQINLRDVANGMVDACT